jgi:hypothetical protein
MERAILAESASSIPSRDHAPTQMSSVMVSTGAAEPVWPSPSSATQLTWERFARYPNYVAAEIVAGLLENEGVPVLVESIGVFPDTTSFSTIWVRKELAHRARWILAWAPPAEAELIFLPTGELSAEQESCERQWIR